MFEDPLNTVTFPEMGAMTFGVGEPNAPRFAAALGAGLAALAEEAAADAPDPPDTFLCPKAMVGVAVAREEGGVASRLGESARTRVDRATSIVRRRKSTTAPRGRGCRLEPSGQLSGGVGCAGAGGVEPSGQLSGARQGMKQDN